MNEVKCKIEGCKEVFKTEEAVSAEARFICKNHPRTVQLAEAGRIIQESDFKDATVHFQEFQFDHDLASGSSPNVDSGQDSPEIDPENLPVRENI